MPEPTPVDYRFLLANERTFLAYVRTALALQVAGLGVLQFLTSGRAPVREALGLVLVAVGSYVGAVGYGRFRRNDVAIRAGRELAPSRLPTVVTVALVVVPVLAGVLLVLI